MEHKQLFKTLETAFRVLTFRSTRAELIGLDDRHLTVGLLATWFVGMGRHWHAADVTAAQSLGLVSIIFVFGLAAVIWAFSLPFGPANWSYRRVLTFLTLAAPPAAVYAIPVERMFVPEIAQHLNLAFLALVSLWRLSLLVFLLTRLGGFSRARAAVVVLLLPVSAVVAALLAGKLLVESGVIPVPC